MSYTAIRGHMLALTQEANSLTKIQSGHCILAYHITRILLFTSQQGMNAKVNIYYSNLL